jgi:UDP-glucose 4-epimerase
VEDPAFDFGLNIEMTFRLLEVLAHRETKPAPGEHFVGRAVRRPATAPIHESGPTVPIYPYGVGELAAERYVAVYSRELRGDCP